MKGTDWTPPPAIGSPWLSLAPHSTRAFMPVRRALVGLPKSSVTRDPPA